MSVFDFIFKGKRGVSRKKHHSKANKKELYNAVIALRKNEIVMLPNEARDVSSPFESKIGGRPYLPADFVWPTYTDKESGITRHLSFFAQINLADIRPYDNEGMLSGDGMLYFFYECESMRWGFDPDDKGAARVFRFVTVDAKEFILHDVPSDIAREYVIPELAISFEARQSYPKFEEFEIYSSLECDISEYDDVLLSLGVSLDTDPDEHKLLGYADLIQDEMLTEAERISRDLYCGSAEGYASTSDEVKSDIKSHAAEWTLLCQISTVAKRNFEYMFGDCGMLYFYIRKSDLADMNFDRVHFSVQCG